MSNSYIIKQTIQVIHIKEVQTMTETKPVIETKLTLETQPEAEEIMIFLEELTPNDRRDFLQFIQGIRYAKRIQDSTSPQRA